VRSDYTASRANFTANFARTPQTTGLGGRPPLTLPLPLLQVFVHGLNFFAVCYQFFIQKIGAYCLSIALRAAVYFAMLLSRMAS